MGGQVCHPAAGLPAGGAIERLHVQVPAAHRQIWLQAESAVWEPWLLRQHGFLGRELFWDPALELGVLLIRWASRQRWHAISAAEVSQVHQAFQRHARELLRCAGHRNDDPDAQSPSASTDCFPLLSSDEVHVEPPLAPPG
ncbi:MAG: TIGR03792 family protein [Synechococcaceae cyanobacterium]